MFWNFVILWVPGFNRTFSCNIFMFCATLLFYFNFILLALENGKVYMIFIWYSYIYIYIYIYIWYSFWVKVFQYRIERWTELDWNQQTRTCGALVLITVLSCLIDSYIRISMYTHRAHIIYTYTHKYIL